MKPLASIDKCTTCTTCVAHCPVVAATRVFNGPKLTGPSSERFRLFSKAEIEALDYCSNCKNCDISCPCGVQVAALNMLARGAHCREQRPPLRDWVLSHGHRMAGLAGVFPHALVRLGMTNPLTRRLLDLFGVDRRAPLPVFAPKRFSALFQALPALRADKKVAFFPGCYIEDYDPGIGMDLVWFLRQAGYEVLIPQFSCCGLPLVANGFLDQAATCARYNTLAFRDYVAQGIPILTSCPSCGLMLTQEYAELFPDLPGLERVAALVQDACAFVAALLDADELKLDFRTSPTRLIYHPPCHLRAQGLGKPGFELLRRLGARIEDAQAGCCGIAGSYGFKKGKYDVAAEVGSALFTAVRESEAPWALTECGTCQLQLRHHTSAQVRHPLSWLRRLAE